MPTKSIVVLLGFALAACASGTGQESNGVGVVDAVGTPFYIAFKVPTCLFNLAAAGPLAGLSQVAQPWPPVNALYPSGTDAMIELRRSLNADVTYACGPPYMVTGSKD